jgi:hypothetical protein
MSNNVASTLPQADWYFWYAVQGLRAAFEKFPPLLF